MTTCPHGDPACPCPDGDPCHYEDPDPMPCPTMRPDTCSASGDRPCRNAWLHRGLTTPHCHVEGCGWRAFNDDGTIRTDPCGLVKIRSGLTVAAAHQLGCGAIRYLVASSADTQPP